MFLSRKCLLQHRDAVPTDCVVPGVPDHHGLWPARRGRHVLPFVFSVAPAHSDAPHISTLVATAPLPSSYWNRRVGGIRYLVAAIVTTKLPKQTPTPMAVYREINLVESVGVNHDREYDVLLPFTSPLMCTTTNVVNQGLFGLKKGQITLTASVRVPKTLGHESGCWVSGQPAFVGVEIKNESLKHVHIIRFALIRRLKTFTLDETTDSPGLVPINYSNTCVYTKEYLAKQPARHSGLRVRDPNRIGAGFAEDDDWYKYGSKGSEMWTGSQPDSLTNLLLDLQIPLSAISIRYGLLVDVSFMLSVSVFVKGGYFFIEFSKEIKVELPVTILSPLSFLDNLPPVKLEFVTHAIYNFNAKKLLSNSNSGVASDKHVLEDAPDIQKNEMVSLGEAVSLVTLSEETERVKNATVLSDLITTGNYKRPVRLFTVAGSSNPRKHGAVRLIHPEDVLNRSATASPVRSDIASKIDEMFSK